MKKPHQNIELKLRAYFYENPDEELTVFDVMEKFDCSYNQARRAISLVSADGSHESVRVVRRKARGRFAKTDEPTLDQAVRELDDFRVPAAWWQDVRAFIALLPRLLESSQGKWALFSNGCHYYVHESEEEANRLGQMLRPGFAPYSVFLIEPLPGAAVRQEEKSV